MVGNYSYMAVEMDRERDELESWMQICTRLGFAKSIVLNSAYIFNSLEEHHPNLVCNYLNH